MDVITEAPDKFEVAVQQVLDRRKLEFYTPYPKQLEFHKAGALYRERLFKAGNQLGKTLGASFETAMHATGKYPADWEGKRFTHPIAGWVGAPTGQLSRDNPQRLLLGRPGEWGTGAIPGDDIVGLKRASGNVPDLIETIQVRHVSGGISSLTLKSYDQGRIRWQGETLHLVWFDEEPDEEVYSEGVTRTNATKGIVYLTFTPLLGMSQVVTRFLKEKPFGTHVTNMTIYDALHYTEEERKAIIAAYPKHEREARAMGVPIMGSGRVFDTPEDTFAILSPMIPPHWPRLAGMDIGWDHPTAVVWMAWDRDTDVVYLYDAYKASETTIAVHAATIKGKGPWIPVAWPHDALQHDKNSGETVAKQYRNEPYKVNMMPFKATHPPERGKLEGTGGYSFEAGVMEIQERLRTGRLKVAKHLNDWFEEYRLYHRKDGLIVKENDDLLSATRIGLMMLRHAKTFQTPRQATIAPFIPSDASMGVLG